MNAQLFLTSTELQNPYSPRICRFTKRLKTEIRDDFGLFEIDPPHPPEIYDTSSQLNKLILVTHHEGWATK